MKNWFRTTVIPIFLALGATPAAWAQDGPISNRLVPKFHVDDGVGICAVVECDEVDGFTAGWTGGWHTTPRDAGSTNLDVGSAENSGETFPNNFEVQPGILGVDTDLNEEFSSFINDFEVRLDRIGFVAEPDSASNLADGAYEYAQHLWSSLINSQNAYFDSIAFIADAETDPQAQNAIAHAAASAHLAMETSIADAFIFGEMKEILMVGDNLDTHKDRMNNAVGREIAVELSLGGGDASDIPQAIADAYRNGQLWIIRRQSIVPSDTPPQDN